MGAQPFRNLRADPLNHGFQAVQVRQLLSQQEPLMGPNVADQCLLQRG
jgi:hypothetical protein